MKDYCGKAIFANCHREIEAVGGKLFFDDTGMTFKSHAINIQTEKHELNIEIFKRHKKEDF